MTKQEEQTAPDGQFIEKHNATLPFGGDKLRPQLDQLVRKASATQEQADLIWWLFAYAKESGFSLSRTAHELGVDNSTIHRIFTCSYGAKLDNICKKISRYKRTIDVRGNINDMPYVATSIGIKVEQVCQAAWASQSIAMIWGDTQTGKTFALEHFARTNNHGTTKYVRLPAKAGIQLVAKEIAKSCYVSTQSSFEGLRERIFKSIDHNNLLIVDEIQEAFVAYLKTSAIGILEFLREIYDRRKCGMVLCMNNIGRDEIERGKLSMVLKQLSRRGVIKLQLPDVAPMKDFLLIGSKAFKLPKPEDDVLEIIKTIRHQNGIGVFSHYLKMGARVAKNKETPYTWDHFRIAYNTLQALSDRSATGSAK